MLEGRRILIGISGSIAAYKIPLLVRLLIKEGVDVKVVMTPSATDFVTPLTLSVLSKHPVAIQPFNPANGQWQSHVDLGAWADLFLMAPVSANTLGKMANGIADNLLLTTYLSAKCPVFFAPAMDLDMYRHPSTQVNISKLQNFGNILIEPREGELASGLCGAGRLEEPEAILQILANYFKKKVALHHKHVLISAGPTFEPIDPVRFVGNHSSGLMGFALAEQAAEMGAKVTLVSGPVKLIPKHPAINLIKVSSAAQMAEACLSHFPNAQITIMAAAVADFTVKNYSNSKIKKGAIANDQFFIEMIPTQDILASMGKTKKADQVLIGFALETDNEKANAQKKLHTKNLDAVVLNSLKDDGAGFGTATNKVTLLFKNGKEQALPLKTKKEVAIDILDEAVKLLNDLNN